MKAVFDKLSRNWRLILALTFFFFPSLLASDSNMNWANVRHKKTISFALKPSFVCNLMAHVINFHIIVFCDYLLNGKQTAVPFLLFRKLFVSMSLCFIGSRKRGGSANHVSAKGKQRLLHRSHVGARKSVCVLHSHWWLHHNTKNGGLENF